ncbi:sensor histidine kinase [Dyadobacter sp. NIV53]|uniref:tetratricopeptide repeat-containing sensor histidine kinase n=1 Tax=Dyadobacter sp. NIV53 TaxID=2861765 RepID=UPI001C88CE07|nr:sensor histidine kinase [Dyadobacter sp. NIV53]
MNILYKLGILISLWLLLSGIQCSSFDQNLSVSSRSEDEYVEKHQAGFARDTLLIHKYHKLGTAYLYQNAEKSMMYAKKVLQLSQKHQWGKGKILAYNLLSTYYLLDGSYDVLRELSNETVILSKRLNLPFYTAHAKRFMAESYTEYRQWDSAQINYQNALAIFTKIGVNSGRAICLENMGNMYRDKNKNDLAIKYYDQAYALYEKLNSDRGKASVLQNKGYLYHRIKSHSVSEKLYLEALELYRKDKNPYGELSIFNDLGNTYYWSKQYDKSIEMCLKAYNSSKQYHSIQQTNWALQTLSRAYREKNMLKKALFYGDEFAYNRRMLHDGYIRRQYTMYQLMYDNQQMGTAIQQKIIDEQSRIQQLLIGFSSLIIAFAAFLWFNNEKLRKKNAEIREALIKGQTIERKRVAAELHDHLGGTLASLNWYLYGMDKKGLSPEEQKIYDSVHQMVGAAYRQVRSLSHNLMPAELEEHGLVTALRRLVGKLNENKNIEFAFNHNGFEKRYAKKVEFELYSIVLELTNNILKHSGATKAVIDINESIKNINLTISDNGSGINQVSKQGIGLYNVKNRIESLSGKIQILDEPEKGTRIEIEIPKTTA